MATLFSTEHKYSGIQDEYEPDEIDQHPKSNRSRSRVGGQLGVLILTNVVTFLAASGLLHFESRTRCPMTVIQEHLSPFMDEIDRTVHIETFNSFEHNTTRYTAKATEAGEEVEKNWVDLGIYGAPVVIPLDEAHYFDIERQHVKLDPEENRLAHYAGVTVKIQAQHFLHCVNLLRQGLWYNRDYYRQTQHPAWDASQEVMYGRYSLVELHTAHCVDQLRQLIMCETDLGVIPFVLAGDGDEDEGKAVFDFGRRRQCRNYQSFLRWHEKWKWEAAGLPEEDIKGHDKRYFSWTGRD